MVEDKWAVTWSQPFNNSTKLYKKNEIYNDVQISTIPITDSSCD